MIEVSNNELKLMAERDKYKSYLIISLMVGFWLFSMATIFYIDVNKQHKAIEEYEDDLGYMAVKLLECKSKEKK